jgi:hypothetical protein
MLIPWRASVAQRQSLISFPFLATSFLKPLFRDRYSGSALANRLTVNEAATNAIATYTNDLKSALFDRLSITISSSFRASSLT